MLSLQKSNFFIIIIHETHIIYLYLVSSIGKVSDTYIENLGSILFFLGQPDPNPCPSIKKIENKNGGLKAKNFISKQNTRSLSLSLCLSLRVRVRVREKNGGASCGGASTDEDGVAAIDVRKRDTDPPTEDRFLRVVVSQFPPIHKVQSSTNRPKPRFASRPCAFFFSVSFSFLQN